MVSLEVDAARADELMAAALLGTRMPARRLPPGLCKSADAQGADASRLINLDYVGWIGLHRISDSRVYTRRRIAAVLALSLATEASSATSSVPLIGA